MASSSHRRSRGIRSRSTSPVPRSRSPVPTSTPAFRPATASHQPQSNQSLIASNPVILDAVKQAKAAAMNPEIVEDLEYLLRVYYPSVSKLRQHQRETLCHIINMKEHENKVLIVQRTGAGKTVLIQAMGLFLRGINIIISPLLALTSNLTPRFKSDADEN
eukprot:scaffold53876_cov80-Cyclotella_meneghiniana.AAC.6